MARRIVRESISIQAPAKTIWGIITNPEFNVGWLAAFGERNIALTDWQEGSKALFIDKSKTGLITIIRESRPFEQILMHNVGLINNGNEDYDSEEAIRSREFYEHYRFTSEDDATRMSVEVVVEDNYYDEVSASWTKALAKIKTQAETSEIFDH